MVSNGGREARIPPNPEAPPNGSERRAGLPGRDPVILKTDTQHAICQRSNEVLAYDTIFQIEFCHEQATPVKRMDWGWLKALYR